MGKSAFDWDVYKNRKSALQYLKRNSTLVDTIIETEDGSAWEFVHRQVISAFGEKLNQFIDENGQYIDSPLSPPPTVALTSNLSAGAEQQQPHQHQRQRQNDNVATTSASSHTEQVNSAHYQLLQLQLQQAQGQYLTRWPRGLRVKLVRLPKLTRYTLGILVDCAYTGYIRTDLPSGGLWQVLDFADQYEMVEVIRACCSFLVKNLNRTNCVQFYHIGIKHRHPLQRSAWHKIRANFKHILASNLRRLESRRPPLQAQAQSQQQVASSSTSSSNFDAQNLPMMTSNQSVSQQQQHVAQQMLLNSLRLHQPNEEAVEELERRLNNLATLKYEHFEPLLMHDKLNVDSEESVWYAIKLWCNYKLEERAQFVTNLLPCMRFPRFRQGTDFSTRLIWRDPLVLNNKEAQHQLAVLDRNHRDFLSSFQQQQREQKTQMDGFNLPCAIHPRQLRPRVPHSILLAIGGWQQGTPTTLIESYDINCNLWFVTPKRIMSPLAYHGIEYINGLLYICGGTDGSEILNEVFTFDPIRGDCLQRPSMRESRCYVSTAHLGDHLYAMGGHNGMQRMKSVERFEVVNGQVWEHMRDMNVARSDASACVHESLIYIAGGLNDQVIESSVEFYNQQDDTWTFAASMLTPRTSFTLLLFQGSFLAIGGNNGTERLSSVEQYSFVSKLWSRHSEMRHKRSTFSAALVDESKLIVVGGYNGQTPFSQVEMFDEQQRQWVLLHKIHYDRSGLKVVAVNDLPNAIDYTFLGRSSAAQASSAE